MVVAAAKVPSGWRPRMLPVNSPGAGGSTCSREWPGSFLRLMNPDRNHGRPWIREEMNELVRFVSLPSWAEVFLSEVPVFWSWLHGILVYFSLLKQCCEILNPKPRPRNCVLLILLLQQIESICSCSDSWGFFCAVDLVGNVTRSAACLCL